MRGIASEEQLCWTDCMKDLSACLELGFWRTFMQSVGGPRTAKPCLRFKEKLIVLKKTKIVFVISFPPTPFYANIFYNSRNERH
jgi:hypothetical protein